MATDFRSGRDFPRRGREEMDGYMWFARICDKARAAAAGTIHDYIYPCPMDRAVLERWAVSPDEFDAAVRANPTDAAMLAWLKGHVDDTRRLAANRYLTEERAENLDRQDGEEGVVAA